MEEWKGLGITFNLTEGVGQLVIGSHHHVCFTNFAAASTSVQIVTAWAVKSSANREDMR